MNGLKKDFPFLTSHPEMVYLDNAATTHMPVHVLRVLNKFYEQEYASVYRSTYSFAEIATDRVERVRESVGGLLGVDAQSLVFTHGATESIAIVAHAWARHTLKAGDEIVLSELEHHANSVPWQQLSRELNVTLKWLAVSRDGTIDPAQLSLITSRTKLVAITASSNVIGDVDTLISGEYYARRSFLADLITRAHAVGARVLIDAAQYVPHHQTDVKKLGADFIVFSAHKMLGPQGVGVLYVRPEVCDQMQPFYLGGGTVTRVTRESYEMKPFPYFLEAGTRPVAAVIGFGAALEYLKTYVDMNDLRAHEAALCAILVEKLSSMAGVRVLGPDRISSNLGHMVSFVMDGIHPHDVAAYLDVQGIAVRAGNQCAAILHNALGVFGSVRASFYVYNTERDVDRLVRALHELQRSGLAKRRT